MAIDIWAKPGTDALTAASLTKLYGVSGTSNPSTVHLTALAYSPLMVLTPYGSMLRCPIEAECVKGDSFWDVKVPYNFDGIMGGVNGGAAGSWSFRFSTIGGSVHIKAGKATAAKYPNNAADMHDLIGVHGDDVDGTDIVIPASKITVSYKHPAGVVSLPFCFAIDDLTGTVNSTQMFNRPPGEILFLGLDMSAALPSSGSSGDTTLSYEFARSKNLTNQVIDGINNITKNGWDVLWIAWKDDADANQKIKRAKAVYVNRVYDRVDLRAALGFG